MMNREFAEINGVTVDVTTVMDKTVEYTPTKEESETTIEECTDLLNNWFDCLGDNVGLEKMFGTDGEFYKAKGWLIRHMAKYPGYNGRYQIILKNESVSRDMEYDNIARFFEYCTRQLDERKFYMDGDKIIDTEEKIKRHIELHSKWVNTLCGSIAERELEHLMYLISEPHYEPKTELFAYTSNMLQSLIFDKKIFDTIDEDTAKQITEKAEQLGIKFRTSAGQKVSKLISKLAKIAELDKHVDIQEIYFTTENGEEVHRTKDMGWNQQFAAFADAINPLDIPATVIISVNPIDFYTMSFGKGWASCHTIDKTGRRRGDSEHNYSGMYCGGTESYMLDESSIIVYTLPADWDGEHPEKEDKIKRCVFYVGEDKLVQSRLYPDGRDGGDNSIAESIRAIVQRVIANMFEAPNLWSLKRGTCECSEVTESFGPHYRDYLNYDDCNVSYMKRIDGYRNARPIKIGVPMIICPSCGKRHYTHDNIFCRPCYEGGVECASCGSIIPRENAYEIDGDWYCDDCVLFCEDCQEYRPANECEEINVWGYRQNEWRVVCDECREDYTYSEHDDLYIPNDDVIETEEGNYYAPDSDGWGACEDCEEYHDYDNMIYDEETNAYYCAACYDELMTRRQEEENE